ncbi:MAG: hypothetical protein KGH93_01300 [Patescibacteria group bacterium]|nr:hypothetical protein [Patescibacteria group bacterium]MDE1945818.1 hypothetical protein [Patescibacteria group bacterium]
MTERHQTSTFLRNALIALAGIIVLGYALYEMHRLITGPSIVVKFPQNGATIATSTISVSGVAKNISDITLDGRPISIEENGDFSETIVLSPGYNVIDIAAEDRFGSTEEKRIEITYRP